MRFALMLKRLCFTQFDWFIKSTAFCDCETPIL